MRGDSDWFDSDWFDSDWFDSDWFEPVTMHALRESMVDSDWFGRTHLGLLGSVVLLQDVNDAEEVNTVTLVPV
eukprot:CAMPEP_0119476780 /NCGR_PEP_ID=MMETSP1344-20130328/7168_1 /TAXON_ID=236787 /ORGANISM="Florenciella parvula, Strain CCMP2471" /LENGTH=72 /DNA_ID=CAMNT_0007510615 /DNA_START=148 /DNA_END=363 /DNA_ORIENTATION=-